VDATLTINCPNNLKIGTGSVADNYVLGYVTAMGQTNPGNPFNTVWFQNPDFLQQKALYDEVCITGFTVYIKPVITQMTAYDQNYALGPALQRHLETYVYTWIDRDANSITASSTNVPAKLGDYDSFKKHAFNKPIKRHVAVTPTWFDCNVVAAAASILGNQFLTARGLLSQLGIYGENLPWSTITSDPEVWATVDVAYHLKFRGKKPVGFSVDADGVITLTPMNLYAPLLPTMSALPPSDSSTGQLIRDVGFDGSGNPLYVTP